MIQKSHDSKNLDLFDLACVANLLANLADVQRVIVAIRLGLSVSNIGILPGLIDACNVPDGM